MSRQDEQVRGVDRVERPASGEPLQERGIVSEVIVPIVASGTAGATNAVVANLLKKDKDK